MVGYNTNILLLAKHVALLDTHCKGESLILLHRLNLSFNNRHWHHCSSVGQRFQYFLLFTIDKRLVATCVVNLMMKKTRPVTQFLLCMNLTAEAKIFYLRI